ncbi:Leucine Rich repeats (2 copies) [Gimesia panareensis]|uniref:Leucine Rich repeats (2 copies) n=1 Tax=Gimesia panareensis TaxID=2527978 RepID=A0A518FPY3_9PLAN|nr:hypothetical protein [Gimesia panareensis]QDV18406.1 Leucine Rich repeats (2 copies) [Gimesia panareensis]
MRKLPRKILVPLALCITAACAAFVWHSAPDARAPVVQQQMPPPEPTSQATLIKLKKLGARWKRNQDGQVYWLFLKRLPLADDDLAVLQELPEVQILTLRGVHTIKGHHLTDAGLRHLIHLKKLRTLDLSANHGFTDACGETLGQLTSLQRLDLRQTAFTAAILPDLTQLKRLVSLTVDEIPLDENTIGYFEQMPLRELIGVRLVDASFPLLPRLTQLSRPPVRRLPIIKDSQLKYLTHFKKIRKLTVELTQGNSDTSRLKYLQALPELESLYLWLRERPEGPLDPTGLLSLAKVPSLKQLKVTAVDAQALEAVSHCTQVEELDLQSNRKRLSPADLHCLKTMSNLRVINLRRSMVCDRLWAELGKLKTLEEIHIDTWPSPGKDSAQKETPAFQMASLKHLTQLPHLKYLELDNFDITDEGLSYISTFRELESLSLLNAQITNAGLLQLRRLEHLKKLNFYGSKIDMDTAEELHRFIPQCRIEDNWCCGCMTIYADQRFTQK